jgi:hypothetical protein
MGQYLEKEEAGTNKHNAQVRLIYEIKTQHQDEKKKKKRQIPLKATSSLQHLA